VTVELWNADGYIVDAQDTNANSQQNKSQQHEGQLHKDKPQTNDTNAQRSNRKQYQRQDKLQQPGLHNTSGQTNTVPTSHWRICACPKWMVLTLLQLFVSNCRPDLDFCNLV